MGGPLAPSPPHAKVPTTPGTLPGRAPWRVGRLEVNRLPSGSPGYEEYPLPPPRAPASTLLLPQLLVLSHSQARKVLKDCILSPLLYWFPRAAITDHHKLGWLKRTEMYSLRVRGWKSNLEVSAGWLPSGGSEGETAQPLSRPAVLSLPWLTDNQPHS